MLFPSEMPEETELLLQPFFRLSHIRTPFPTAS